MAHAKAPAKTEATTPPKAAKPAERQGTGDTAKPAADTDIIDLSDNLGDIKAMWFSRELEDENVADFDKTNGTEIASVVSLAQAIRSNDEKTISGLRGRHFRFAKTNETLKGVGLSGDYFTIRSGVILRHNGKDELHNITPDEWFSIADALTNREPQAVEKRSEGSFRIWTQATIGGRVAVVGADVKNAGRDIDVNSIATVFGAEGINIKKENLVYPKTKEEKQSVLTRLNSGRYTTSLQEDGSITQTAGKDNAVSDISWMSRELEEHTDEEREAHNLMLGVKIVKSFAVKGGGLV